MRIIILISLLIIGCGKDDPRMWHGSPENKSCVEQGGQFMFMMGNQYCSASGYYCVMPGEKPPCN